MPQCFIDSGGFDADYALGNKVLLEQNGQAWYNSVKDITGGYIYYGRRKYQKIP